MQHKCATQRNWPQKTIDRKVKIVYRAKEADNGQDGVTLVLFFPALFFFLFFFFFVSMPFLTPKISRVSTSLCAGRLSFASEKGKFISGGSIFLLPHTYVHCQRFWALYVCVCGCVDMLLC